MNHKALVVIDIQNDITRHYYADKGCEVRTLAEYRSAAASGV